MIPPVAAPLPAIGPQAAPARAPQRLVLPRCSLRSRGLNRLLRWLKSSPLRHDTDLVALRRGLVHRARRLRAQRRKLPLAARDERLKCGGAREGLRALSGSAARRGRDARGRLRGLRQRPRRRRRRR